MLAGHLTTAILAKQRAPAGHFGFYLVACQLPDLLWLIFHYLGIEPTAPDNFMLVSLQALEVEMTYSHDLLPLPIWSLLTLLIGRGLFGSWRPGLAGAVLVVVHSATDNIGGFEHFVFGPDSQVVATGLYSTAPYWAITFELVFTVATMAWVIRTDAAQGVVRSRATRIAWASVFGGGLAFMYVNATHSLADLLGAEPNPAFAGTTVPVLALTYGAMLIAMYWAEGRSSASRAT
ncbi:MAG: hypothetical protein AAF721_06720 [Myxococcota bacterium]